MTRGRLCSRPLYRVNRDMIVVLEGADLVGKSTLAKLLSERLGVPTTRIWMDLEYPAPSAKSVAHTLHLFCKAINPTIIFDRLFVSEYIYGTILGRPTEYLVDLMDLWADLPNVYFVLMTASDETIRHRYYERGGDWYLDIEQILAANRIYSSILGILPNNFTVLSLDTTQKNTEICGQIVVDWLSRSMTGK